MNIILFYDGCLETKGSPRFVYDHVADRVRMGYKVNNFIAFEENDNHQTFDDYYENEDEVEIEDLMYVCE